MTDHGSPIPGDPIDDDELDEFGLACSSCNADLDGDARYQSHRVCGSCGRHFWMPARERIALLLDPGSFQETSAELVSVDPLLFHDRLPVADRLAEAREQPTVADAAVTGTGAIGGQPAVVVALDLAVLGAGIGVVAGEKIVLAIEHAVTRRLPVVAICSGGSAKGQEGVLALAQIGKLASAAARLRRVGVPLIALATHPTTGNVLVGLAHQADFSFAEPGAQIGLDGARPSNATQIATAEAVLEHGAVDGIVPRDRQREVIERLLRLLANRGVARIGTAPHPSADALRAGDELTLAQHPQRPDAREYIARIGTDFVELKGDRAGADSAGVAGGIARIGDVTSVVLGVTRDGGLNGQAFAKVNRLLRLAAHLELPLVAFVETVPEPAMERSDTGLGMALTLSLLTAMPVPVVTVVIGEVCGLGGMTLLAADRVVMQEHAVISVSAGAAVASARDCLRLGLIDAIVPEPDPAADADPAAAADALGRAISHALAEIAVAGSRRLADDRLRRLRHLGLSTPEGREVARVEWTELQEVQRRIGRSLEDLRTRWEHRQLTIPALSGRAGAGPLRERPNLAAIAIPKLTFKRPDLAEFANRMQATRRNIVERTAREPREQGRQAPDAGVHDEQP